MAIESAPPEHDTDNMTEEQVNEAIGKIAKGEPIESQEQEVTPEPEEIEETQEADVEALANEEHDDKPKSETVPHKTFHYANERRKAAERERDELRDKYTRAEERMRLILEAQQPKQETQQQIEEEIPDAEVDPQGAVKWVQNQILTQHQESQRQQREQAERQQYEQQVGAVLNQAVQQFNAATAADPTVSKLYEGVVKSFEAELKAQGFTDPQQLRQQALEVEKQHVLYAQSRGINIVDYMRALANARNVVIANDPEPTADTPARDATGKFAAAEKREKAKAAGQSLGAAGGAVANMGGITPEMLLNMSDEEFKSYMDKNGGSLRKAYAVN